MGKQEYAYGLRPSNNKNKYHFQLIIVIIIIIIIIIDGMILGTIIGGRKSCRMQSAKCKVQTGTPTPIPPPLGVVFLPHDTYIWGVGICVSYRLVVYLC